MSDNTEKPDDLRPDGELHRPCHLPDLVVALDQGFRCTWRAQIQGAASPRAKSRLTLTLQPSWILDTTVKPGVNRGTNASPTESQPHGYTAPVKGRSTIHLLVSCCCSV